MSIIDRFKVLFFEELHMNQAEIAAFLEVSPQAVNKWLRGINNISSGAVHTIANKVDGLNIEWLKDGSGPMFKHNPNSNIVEESQAPYRRTPTPSARPTEASVQVLNRDIEYIITMLTRMYAEQNLLRDQVSKLQADLQHERTINRTLLEKLEKKQGA